MATINTDSALILVSGKTASRFQFGSHKSLSPLPMTRVNCPGMSPSEMGVAGESPSQGGGLCVWKPSEAESLSAAVFVASAGEAALSCKV